MIDRLRSAKGTTEVDAASMLALALVCLPGRKNTLNRAVWRRRNPKTICLKGALSMVRDGVKEAGTAGPIAVHVLVEQITFYSFALDCAVAKVGVSARTQYFQNAVHYALRQNWRWLLLSCSDELTWERSSYFGFWKP